MSCLLNQTDTARETERTRLCIYRVAQLALAKLILLKAIFILLFLGHCSSLSLKYTIVKVRKMQKHVRAEDRLTARPFYGLVTLGLAQYSLTGYYCIQKTV